MPDSDKKLTINQDDSLAQGFKKLLEEQNKAWEKLDKRLKERSEEAQDQWMATALNLTSKERMQKLLKNERKIKKFDFNGELKNAIKKEDFGVVDALFSALNEERRFPNNQNPLDVLAQIKMRHVQLMQSLQ